MYELFAVVAGVVIALVVRRIAAPQLRALTLVACSVAFGLFASSISGELLVSWTFLAFDIAQVLLSAGMTMILVSGWQAGRRRASDRSFLDN